MESNADGKEASDHRLADRGANARIRLDRRTTSINTHKQNSDQRKKKGVTTNLVSQALARRTPAHQKELRAQPQTVKTPQLARQLPIGIRLSILAKKEPPLGLPFQTGTIHNIPGPKVLLRGRPLLTAASRNIRVRKTPRLARLWQTGTPHNFLELRAPPRARQLRIATYPNTPALKALPPVPRLPIETSPRFPVLKALLLALQRRIKMRRSFPAPPERLPDRPPSEIHSTTTAYIVSNGTLPTPEFGRLVIGRRETPGHLQIGPALPRTSDRTTNPTGMTTVST
jgi:hypothetical protein